MIGFIGWFSRESRYLLILTENYAALPIIQRQLLKEEDDAVVIFGSSFPKDQEYTQVLSYNYALHQINNWILSQFPLYVTL